MLSIERRVAALEADAKDCGLKVVVLDDGEAESQALARLGPPRGAVIVFASILDEML